MAEKSVKGRLNIVNRDEYAQFLPSPVAKYRVKKRITSVKLKMISHDARYAELKKRGLNIDITSPEIYGSGGQKPINGIFSPLFGADATQDSPVYTCECRKLVGRVNRGKICPKCKTECRSIDADLRICGYIDIAPYHILSYHGFNAMSKVLKNLMEILTSTKRIDSRGKEVDDGLPTILDLYEDYDDKYYPLTGIPKDIAFMSKIPVYSSRLRPLIQFGKKLTVLEPNKRYMSIVRYRNILKTAPLIKSFKRSVEIQKALNQIQMEFLKPLTKENGQDKNPSIVSTVLDQISGKPGAFRRSLASGRVDNSARLVISLGQDLMAHELDLPYQTMMVLYEDKIAHYLSVLDNIPIGKAISIVEEHQTVKSEKFVKIINQILKQGNGIWVLINRNPTISESGILYMKVRKIHEDGSDLTCHLPQDILALLAADFDCTLCQGHSPALQECGCCA